MRVPWSQCRLIAIVVLLGITGVATSEAEEYRYIGTHKCKACHVKQYKSWAETSMAKAFTVLLPGENAEAKQAAGLDPDLDYSTDPGCLSCHTTGYGKPGGFTDLESTPNLAGVGCEMCHGPGGTYTQKQYMSLKNRDFKREDIVAVGLVDQITVHRCLGCHNVDSPFVGEDFVFDFEAKKHLGTHTNYELKYKH